MAISSSSPVNQTSGAQVRQEIMPGSGSAEAVDVAKVAAKASSSAAAATPQARQEPKPPTRTELEKIRDQLVAQADQISLAIEKRSKQLVSSMLFEDMLRQQEQIEADAKKDRAEASDQPSIADTDSPIPMSELFALTGRKLPEKIAALSDQAIDVQVRIDRIDRRLENLDSQPKTTDPVDAPVS